MSPYSAGIVIDNVSLYEKRVAQTLHRIHATCDGEQISEEQLIDLTGG